MASLRTVRTGLDFGEGPRWHEGRLWYSDFYRHAVFALDDAGVEERIVALDDQPSGLGWSPDGDLLVVAMIGQKVLRIEAGRPVEHADLSPLAVGKCNDMVVAADGTAYVGCFGFDLEAGETPRPTRLLRVDPDGAVSVAADEMWFPNGAVITPDDRTLIVGETFGGRFTAFTIGDDGTLADRRVWAEVPGHAPDGCCLDAEGAIWFADPVTDEVVRVREGGEIVDVVATSQSAVACMLGGPGRRTLYVLSSPGTHPDDVAGRAGGRIEALEVDVPGAGRP
ncbi:MAG: hypothetical protein D6683_10780 [Actinomyces sp.]|nr:MAG: hypothetical protein D6683_10780 [Actinomyces sp.]